MQLTMELSKELAKYFAGDIDLVDMLRAIKYCALATQWLETEHTAELRRALDAVSADITAMFRES